MHEHEPPEWPAKARPDLMTVEDASLRLNVSDSFVYQQIASGRLKHHRLGKGQGGIRISEEQLADFLRATERGGEQPEPTEPIVVRPRGQFQHLPPKG